MGKVLWMKSHNNRVENVADHIEYFKKIEAEKIYDPLVHIAMSHFDRLQIDEAMEGVAVLMTFLEKKQNYLSSLNVIPLRR